MRVKRLQKIIVLNEKTLRALRIPSRPSRLWLRRNAKRIGIAVAGSLVVLVGISLIPLPGPGLATILLGLMILEAAFPEARQVRQTIVKNIPALRASILLAAAL